MKQSSLLSGFLKSLPKAELHTHIDGCLRPETIISIAKKTGIELPSYDPSELVRMTYQERYVDLVDLLKIFGMTTSVMRTVEALEQIGYEFVQDYIKDGVYYLEGRFAPQQHVGFSIHSIEDVILAINRGMKRAADEHNSLPEVVNKQKPQFHYGIICCILRCLFRNISPYYDHILDSFKYSSKKAAEVQAGMELVHACVDARDKHSVPIVAIDLAGAELGNPPEDFKEPFDLAKKNLVGVVIHAGEADGPESVFGAVTAITAERIGHGLHLFDSHMAPKRQESEKFCYNLSQYMARKGITVEVCMTCNIQTMPGLKSIADHPVKKMISHGVPVSFSCDNTFITQTCLSNELELAITKVGVSMEEIKKAIFNSFEKSLFFGSAAQKTEYVSSIKAYYEALEAKFNAK